MNGYFVYDNGNGSFDTFDNEEDARKEAEKILDAYRDEAPDGWADESLNLCWGAIIQSVIVANQETYDPDIHCFSCGCDYVEERVLVSEDTARVIAKLEEKIIDLQAQLAAAKRDADCLRTLERKIVCGWNVYPVGDGRWCMWHKSRSHYGDTIQSAIEAAREGE